MPYNNYEYTPNAENELNIYNSFKKIKINSIIIVCCRLKNIISVKENFCIFV